VCGFVALFIMHMEIETDGEVQSCGGCHFLPRGGDCGRSLSISTEGKSGELEHVGGL